MTRTLGNREDVASRIRALRGRVPQPQIASQVGVTLRAYQGWEAGGGIAWPNLQKLAEIHGVSTHWLQHGEEEIRSARSQLDRIEEKLDGLLARIGALPLDDLFETSRGQIDTAQDGRRGSRGQRAG